MSTEMPICVIEDNTPIRKLFCTILKKAGFSTVDFADGKSALEWLDQNKPLAVIVDILLPDMNGTELHDQFRAKDHGKDVPMVAATGFAKSNDREKYLEMGFDAYIPKPVNTNTFADEIKTVIDEKNSANS